MTTHESTLKYCIPKAKDVEYIHNCKIRQTMFKYSIFSNVLLVIIIILILIVFMTRKPKVSAIRFK
jgi:hypothetical protein